MKTKAFALLSLLMLAACGADGMPKPPPDSPQTGVTGEVSLGVRKG